MLGESSPALTGSEIEHNKARASFVTAVDDICHALTGLCNIGTQVEADVVHV